MTPVENKHLGLFKKVTYSFVGVNSGLVLILGLFVFVPIFSTQTNDIESTNAAVSSVERGMASLPGALSGSAKNLNMGEEMQTLDLDCLKPGSMKKIKTTARQVRVRGRWCAGQSAHINPQIKNRSGGYEATLFQLENGDFTSDYIALEKGDNRLVLTVETKSGDSLISEVSLQY